VSANKGFCIFTGYGFVDFDSPAAAQKAVASLKANGVQAQMAKVRLLRFACVRARVYVCICKCVLKYFSFAVSWLRSGVFIYLLGKINSTITLAWDSVVDLFHCFSVYIY
jgi:uncharacterized protein YegP (UPF0339 family)